MKIRRIPLHNALQIREYLEIWDEGENDFVPFQGLGSWRISDTPTGDAIGDLHDFLAETEEYGVFVAPISSALIDANLADHVGKTVYLIIKAGPANELEYVVTYFVVEPRNES